MSITGHGCILLLAWPADNLKKLVQSPSLLSKERPHGHDRLERPPHVGLNSDAVPHNYAARRGTNSLHPLTKRGQPAPKEPLFLPRLPPRLGRVRIVKCQRNPK